MKRIELLYSYLNSSFMGKSAAVNVLEHFNTSVKSIENNKILQVFSDGPKVNLAFLRLNNEQRHDVELNPLIDIWTCSLHTVHNSFQNGEMASSWNLKKLLNAMFYVFL